jgi:hypothetical protein
MTQPVSVEEYAATLAKEYGQYVATEAIDIGGARAFNAGDPVPASHVERGVVPREQVVGSNTKTARAVTSEKG